MTSPSPNPPSNSLSSSTAASTGVKPSQSTPLSPSQPHAWASDQSHPSRRGPAAISTTSSTASATLHQSRPSSSSQSHPPRNPWSPTSSIPAPSAPTNLQSKTALRSASISSSGTSTFAASLSSSSSSAIKQRTIASSINPPPASAAAALQTTTTTTSTTGAPLSSSAGGGGGAAGPNPNNPASGSSSSGGGSAKPYRASPSLSGSGLGSPTGPSGPIANPTTGPGSSKSSTSSLTQIVVAQLFLLLSTIKEDKDSPKWEQEADKIRKLVESHGMDVFTKYFRRLLLQNSSQIWAGSSTRNLDSSGSYPILASEVQKVTTDPAQAAKIVESVEFGEGEIFKDFELFTFMEHFKMTPFGKVTLASAFRRASKPDLRTKADAIISNNFQSFLNTIASQSPSQAPDSNEDLVFATILDRLAQDPPRNWSNELHQNLVRAFERRYHASGLLVPLEISSALVLFDLVIPSNPLVRLLQKHGPKATESLESCKSILETTDLRDISYQQVASALLFMVIARDDPPYNSSIFISALREHRGGQRLDWQDVLHALDRDGLKITKLQFKRLFDALVPLAHEYENFDLQLLWGGEWRHEETQLAFVAAFLSFSESELDASQIPRLRKAFTVEDFADASDDVKAYADTAIKHPLVSLDATKALFGLVFQSSDTYTHAQSFGVVDNIINPKMDLFVGAVSAVPKPWGALQDQAIKQLVGTLFFTGISGHGFALHLLWKRDKTWLSTRLFQLYQGNPMHLVPILELAHEHGWLEDLIRVNTELSLDLAALAHGRHLFDLESWLQQIAQAMQRERVVPALCTFLNNKIEDDLSTQKDKTPPRTVPLSVRTAHALLTFLGNEGLPEADRSQLQRAAISAYPRLINYGEGFDDIIDANGRDSNAFSPEADAKMQDHYKELYGTDYQVRTMIETLQKYKMSRDPPEQDLFACMIFGLFDEYNCYAEYPLQALSKTAVLFGSIINYNLLSKVALQVAIAMVLEAVREYPPEESMYKFGLQALVNFKARLEEWTRLSEILLEIPALRGSLIYPELEKIAREKEEAPNNADQDETDKGAGAADDFLAAEPNVPEFSCLSVDPPARLDFYEEPDDQVQEGVLFILNNVSARNIKEKSADLKANLKEKHHQWFANYLVESRIKTQPNFHQLYMDILLTFDSNYLWFEVLRETFVSVIRMLNAESTMNSSNERSLLKNLGSWLGSMTLARNSSIKHKNISFKDLLTEAHDTQRLLVAIPFTCKVLSTAVQSEIFKPPCSWTMEILHILIELYEFADLKLNLKFEIEVLCKDLGIDHNELEASNVIRSRPLAEEEMLPVAMPDGMEGFSDISLIPLHRPRGLAERFSPTNILPQLAELAATLKHHYPLPTMNLGLQNRIRSLLSEAVERATSEIIGPVVERSVTIAAIAASQLMAKDFALEPDENRYRECAHNSVRPLASSLAGVTCKEPLRVSMQNNINHIRQELPEHTLPQNSVVMFVNDNLDNVCNFVEKAAESASMNEIDAQIEDAVRQRQRHDFVEPAVSKWAYFIPEPFKPVSGGLNPDQLAIYEDFSRAGLSASAHQSLSQDGARQLPDVLQEPFPNALAAASDPSISAASLHLPFGDQPLRPTPDPHSQPLVNGFLHGQALENQTSDLVNGLRQAAGKSLEEDPSRPLAESPLVRDAWVRLFRAQINAPMPAQKHEAALVASRDITHYLVQAQDRQEVLDILAQALRKFCEVSDIMAQYIYTWCMDPAEERTFNVPLTVALLRCGLIDVHRLDLILAAAIEERKPGVVNFFDELVGNYWLADSPSVDFRGAWRADLARSMAALTQWMTREGSVAIGEQIKQRLQDPPTNITTEQEDQKSAKEFQAEYTFEEWIRLQMNNSPAVFSTSFAQQLAAKPDFTTREGSLAFVRACINASLVSYEQAARLASDASDASFIKIDAFAKLLVLMMLHHTKGGHPKAAKITFLEDNLSMITLVFAQHYQRGADVFNPRLFFRMYSTLVCEIHSMFPSDVNDLSDLNQTSIQAIGKSLAMLNPGIFPAFAFSWLSLISHRLFMPTLLKSPDEECRSLYCQILCQQLSYVGELMKPLQIDSASKDLYKGTLRVLLVLHHDFPQFLAEYHLQILNKTPPHCTQMRSLIISASPPFPEFPDPFHEGLRVDRLEESKRSPVIRGGLDHLLHNQEVLDVVNNILGANEVSQGNLNTLLQAINSPRLQETGPGFLPISVDIVLLNTIIVYLVQQAEAVSRPRPLSFSANSQPARLLDALMDNLSTEGRYYLLGAIVNQLRYPNSHTHFFSFALFHLYRAGATDRLALDIQQQIVRVLLERIVAHRPHPWGLMVVLLEFLKNRSYHLWDTPFVQAAPEVDKMLSSLLQQMGQNART